MPDPKSTNASAHSQAPATAESPDDPLTGDEEIMLLRAVEVAQFLGVSRSKVYAMMSEGALPVVRIGRAIRVPRHALATWIHRRTVDVA